MPRKPDPNRATLAAAAAAAGIRKLRYRLMKEFGEENVVADRRPESDGSPAAAAHWQGQRKALERMLLETARDIFRKAEELEETAGGDPLWSVSLTWTPHDDRCEVQMHYRDCGNRSVPLNGEARQELRALAEKVFVAADVVEDDGRFDHPILLTADTPTGAPTKLVSDPGDVRQHGTVHDLAAAAARHLRTHMPDWEELDADGIVDTYLRVERDPREPLELLACPLTGVPVAGPGQTC